MHGVNINLRSVVVKDILNALHLHICFRRFSKEHIYIYMFIYRKLKSLTRVVNYDVITELIFFFLHQVL